MIAIVDLGLGNTGSIQNMLRKVGAASVITADHRQLEQADKLILPGVGAFDAAAGQLTRLGLLPVLHRKAMVEKAPVLGICLGMQLLAATSEEGRLQGLGWLQVPVRRLPNSAGLRIPHMGWNVIRPLQPHPLLQELPEALRFYFVHSYYVDAAPEDKVATCDYGLPFAAMVARGNIMGVQFHPERSHRFGASLLRNFSLL